jgi:hypothetical protein
MSTSSSPPSLFVSARMSLTFCTGWKPQRGVRRRHQWKPISSAIVDTHDTTIRQRGETHAPSTP